jgi:hypothetical protein
MMSMLDVAITSVLAKRYENADQDAQNKALALSMFLPGGIGVVAGQAILKEADEEAVVDRPTKPAVAAGEIKLPEDGGKRGEAKARIDAIAAAAVAAQKAAAQAQRSSDEMRELLEATNRRMDDLKARLDELSPKTGK